MDFEKLIRHQQQLYLNKLAGIEPSNLELCQATTCEIDDLKVQSDETLWKAHAKLTASEQSATSGSVNLLELKAELARRLLAPCRQCWLQCDVNRLNGEIGDCGLGADFHVYNDFIHLGEEPEVSPSYAIFTSGCNFRCLFCSDWKQVVKPRQSPATTPTDLAARINSALKSTQTIRTVSFVGGLPDVNLWPIIETLKNLTGPLPIIGWNSNLSMSAESGEVLDSLVDIHIADFKFGNDSCAKKIANIDQYLSLVKSNLAKIITSAFVIVRVLNMPGHTDCCIKPILGYLSQHFPGLRVNLMNQYWPMPQAKRLSSDYDELKTTISNNEWSELESTLASYNLQFEPLVASIKDNLIEANSSKDSGESESREQSIMINDDGTIMIENLDPTIARLLKDFEV